MLARYPAGACRRPCQRHQRGAAGHRVGVLDGVAVRAGQPIGFVDDRLVASGDDLVEVAAKAVAAANLAEAELITIFTGASVEGDAANDLRDALLAASSDVAVELVNGGQPHYPFVIAVE